MAKMEQNRIKIMLDKKVDYENFEAKCPECKQWTIYNRITDLKTLKPISGMDVCCSHCNKQFRILFDYANMGFEKLIMDCYGLIKCKKYLYTIINLCIAYEMFFATILYFKLVLIPLKSIKNDKSKDICSEHNNLNEKLNNKIKKFTYKKMMGAVMKLLIEEENQPILTIQDSINYINNINGNIPSDLDIKSISNKKIRKYLCVLKKMDKKEKSINHIRNKVAHKTGYRPTLLEAEKELKHAEFFIYGIKKEIDLFSVDLNYILHH